MNHNKRRGLTHTCENMAKTFCVRLTSPFQLCLYSCLLLTCVHTSSVNIRFKKSDKDDSQVFCDSGERLVLKNREAGKDYCLPCPPETYMDYEHHRETKCYPCQKPPSPRKLVLKNCTPVSNAVLTCAPNNYKYYSHKTSKEFDCHDCRKCSTPESEARPCRPDGYTICCDATGMVVDSAKMECVDPTKTTTSSPANPCSWGQFEYRQAGQSPTPSRRLCLTCTVCCSSFQARPCGPYVDTVCCPHQDMEAVLIPITGQFRCQFPPGHHIDLVSPTTPGPHKGSSSKNKSRENSTNNKCSTQNSSSHSTNNPKENVSDRPKPSTTNGMNDCDNDTKTVFIIALVICLVLALAALAVVLAKTSKTGWLIQLKKCKRSRTPPINTPRRRRHSLLNNGNTRATSDESDDVF